jgi:uncharacterized protein (TIGR02466 family)
MRDNMHNIFSVPIWGGMLQNHQYQNKNYIDKILELERTQPSVKKSNFGGYQTHENLHKDPIFIELATQIESLANEADQFPLKLSIESMWGNINYYKDFNGNHTHGGILSGVYYVEIHENCGKLILVNTAPKTAIYKGSNFPIDPTECALILFPSWLEHYVEPNQTNERRISISFNLDFVR